MKKSLVWFKNDLRLTYNLTLNAACKDADKVLALYIFDPREWGQHKLGFSNLGGYKFQFVAESLLELREKIAAKGGNIIVKIGEPEIIIPQITRDNQITNVYATAEDAFDEKAVQAKTTVALKQFDIQLHLIEQSTLVEIHQLPFAVENVPDQFTTFRKSVEKAWRVSDLETCDVSFGKWPSPTSIPAASDLGIDVEVCDARADFKFTGGADAAEKRLKYYLWDSGKVANYKNTRNELEGPDYSSRLSAWLAVGAISSRQVYHEVKKYEAQKVKNESTYWLIFELLWRDFFKIMTKKHGNKIFLKHGFSSNQLRMNNDPNLFLKWRLGETGQPFIDACMKELMHTGYMSNRGRQIAASYLINELEVNWTWGAAWFQNRLIDYDPSSNWLNWAYIAGVGNDPRKGRHFDVQWQSQKYDPNGVFVRKWG